MIDIVALFIKISSGENKCLKVCIRQKLYTIIVSFKITIHYFTHIWFSDISVIFCCPSFLTFCPSLCPFSLLIFLSFSFHCSLRLHQLLRHLLILHHHLLSFLLSFHHHLPLLAWVHPFLYYLFLYWWIIIK